MIYNQETDLPRKEGGNITSVTGHLAIFVSTMQSYFKIENIRDQ